MARNPERLRKNEDDTLKSPKPDWDIEAEVDQAIDNIRVQEIEKPASGKGSEQPAPSSREQKTINHLGEFSRHDTEVDDKVETLVRSSEEKPSSHERPSSKPSSLETVEIQEGIPVFQSSWDKDDRGVQVYTNELNGTFAVTLASREDKTALRASETISRHIGAELERRLGNEKLKRIESFVRTWGMEEEYFTPKYDAARVALRFATKEAEQLRAAEESVERAETKNPEQRIELGSVAGTLFDQQVTPESVYGVSLAWGIEDQTMPRIQDEEYPEVNAVFRDMGSRFRGARTEESFRDQLSVTLEDPKYHTLNPDARLALYIDLRKIYDARFGYPDEATLETLYRLREPDLTPNETELVARVYTEVAPALKGNRPIDELERLASHVGENLVGASPQARVVLFDRMYRKGFIAEDDEIASAILTEKRLELVESGDIQPEIFFVDPDGEIHDLTSEVREKARTSDVDISIDLEQPVEVEGEEPKKFTVFKDRKATFRSYAKGLPLHGTLVIGDTSLNQEMLQNMAPETDVHTLREELKKKGVGAFVLKI